MMQANWSLAINILLLIGVIFTIGRMMKARRQKLSMASYSPSIGVPEGVGSQDEVIAVRKINLEPDDETQEMQSVAEPVLRPNHAASRQPASMPLRKPMIVPADTIQAEQKPDLTVEPASSLMMFLLAKDNRLLAGYELLQTVLAAGLRFGDGQLFHRHQSANGHGPVLCSLAAATPSGIFDMQNIGAFKVHGLCLFMQASGNPTIDAERFAIMLDIGKQLSEGLDTHLLDDRRQPLTDASIKRYYRLLNL